MILNDLVSMLLILKVYNIVNNRVQQQQKSKSISRLILSTLLNG